MAIHARRTPLLLACSVAAVAVLAAGCGGGSSGTSSATTSAAAAGTTVTVNETEFHLALSTASFRPGAYTFTAVNKGTIAHSLEITGPGVDAQTPTLEPGQSAGLHVTLEAGSYDLFCPIDSHKSLGMNQEISVGGATAAPTA
jgi:plastocyanin